MRYWCIYPVIVLTALLWQAQPRREPAPGPKASETQSTSTTGAQVLTAQEQGQPTPPNKFSLPPWTDPVWSSWALVVVAVLTAWIALRTLNDLKEQTAAAKASAEAAKKSAEVAEMSLKDAERADILLCRCSLDWGETGSPAECQVVVEYQNFGRTRGNEVKLTLDLTLEGLGLPKTDCEAVPFITLGAGESKRISSLQFGQFLGARTSDAIFSRRVPLRFESGVTYKDIFGSAHSSTYAGTYNWANARFHLDSQSTS